MTWDTHDHGHVKCIFFCISYKDESKNVSFLKKTIKIRDGEAKKGEWRRLREESY